MRYVTLPELMFAVVLHVEEWLIHTQSVIQPVSHINNTELAN